MSSRERVRFYQRLDFRLAAWYALSFLIMIGLIFWFLDYRVRSDILKEIDRMLFDEVDELVHEVLESPGNLTEAVQRYQGNVSRRKFYHIIFRVLDARGTPLYTSARIKGTIFPFPKPVPANNAVPMSVKNVRLLSKSSPFRLYTYYYRAQGRVTYIVQVATYLRLMKKNVRNFRQNLAIAFLLSLFSASVGGWLLSRKSLSPIHGITQLTKRITATSLQERLALRGTDDELDQLARTINQMIGRLEDSFRRLHQFTADASHELRTPLTALKGQTEVFLAQERTPEEYREALVENLERLDYLIKLLNGLLFLSRADEGQENLQVENVDLRDLLRDLWEAFNPVALQKEISFVFLDFGKAWVQGDPVKLKQLFVNLIDNAIKYTLPQGRIRLSFSTQSDQVVVVLADTGIGIPPEDLPRIFDRFYRVDKSRSRQSGGTGLGLSICQWIVQAHGGSITTTSKPRQGTTFTVALPRNFV